MPAFQFRFFPYTRRGRNMSKAAALLCRLK
jgi:hypothetical protein